MADTDQPEDVKRILVARELAKYEADKVRSIVALVTLAFLGVATVGWIFSEGPVTYCYINNKEMTLREKNGNQSIYNVLCLRGHEDWRTDRKIACSWDQSELVERAQILACPLEGKVPNL